MIATIADMIVAIIWKPLSSDRWDRLQFYLNDRSDPLETHSPAIVAITAIIARATMP